MWGLHRRTVRQTVGPCKQHVTDLRTFCFKPLENRSWLLHSLKWQHHGDNLMTSFEILRMRRFASIRHRSQTNNTNAGRKTRDFRQNVNTFAAFSSVNRRLILWPNGLQEFASVTKWAPAVRINRWGSFPWDWKDKSNLFRSVKPNFFEVAQINETLSNVEY